MGEPWFEKGEGWQLVKRCNVVMNWKIFLKKKGPILETWGLNLRNGNGKVCKGGFENPDVSIVLSDQEFWNEYSGKSNMPMAFLNGSVRIDGSFKKANQFSLEMLP